VRCSAIDAITVEVIGNALSSIAVDPYLDLIIQG